MTALNVLKQLFKFTKGQLAPTPKQKFAVQLFYFALFSICGKTNQPRFRTYKSFIVYPVILFLKRTKAYFKFGKNVTPFARPK